MKNIRFRVLIFFLILITCTINSYSQLTEQQINAFNSVKKVRILEEHFLFKGHSYSSSLSFTISPVHHFKETAKIFLKFVGIEVVNTDTEDYDATLRIQTKSVLLEEISRENDACLLSGSISLEVPGVPCYKKQFQGIVYQVNMVSNLKYLNKFYLNPDIAAILVPGSFLSTIKEIFREVFSINVFNSYFMITDKYLEINKINAEFVAGKMRDTSTVGSLIYYVFKDENTDVRSMAAWALGEINDKRCIEPLIYTLNDKKKIVRKNAVQSLVKINYDRSIPHLYTDISDISNNKDKYVQFLSKAVLRQMKDNQGIKEIIEELKNKKQNIRIKAAESLVDITDTSAVIPLIAALQDENKKVRVKAAWALGKIKDTCAVEPLIVALNDNYYYVRNKAAWALGMIKDNRAVKPLIYTLKDEGFWVQKEAAWALGELKDNRSIEPLISSIKDATQLELWSSIEALLKIGKPAVKPLIAALRNYDKTIRIHAVIALGLIKDKSAVEFIIPLLKDDYCRWVAITSLASINDRQAVEPIIPLLKDENDFIRAYSAKALGKLGDPRAVEYLIYTLKDKELHVQLSAAWALGELKDSSAIGPLIATINHEHVPISSEVNSEVANSLNEITGKDFGENKQNWKEWWDQNK
jgi:HEAT repeat protein